jgi:hypothetical protein
MSSMIEPRATLRRSAVALAVLAAAAGALAPTPAAEAVSGCLIPATIVGTTITPARVVVGVAEPKGITITTKVRTNGCRIDRVEAGLYGPDFVDSYDLAPTGSSNGVTTYETGLRISPGSLPNSEAGRWQSFISVWGATTPNAPGPDFSVVRASRLTTDASPEPVRKGKTITVRGSVRRANWQTLHYAGFGKQKVELQWRSPKGTYHRVATVTSARDGSLKAKITAKRDGCFRFVLTGSASTARGTSKGDCVDVR